MAGFFNLTNAVKMNIAFSFILRHVTMGELRFFAAGNNASYFDLPFRITNRNDMNTFIHNFNCTDYLEHIHQMKPDSKWVVDDILSLHVFSYKMYTNGLPDILLL